MPRRPTQRRDGAEEAPSATAECPACRQWESGADDDYCGFCGHPLVPLQMSPEAIILISALAPQRAVSFHNAGPRPLQALLVPRTGPPFPALVLEPAGSFDVPAGGTVQVRATLDPERIPDDFQERELDYVCLINNDRRRQLPLRVKIKSGPRPKLLTPVLDFGEVAEGRKVEKTVELANVGGTPLKIREVRAEGSSRLRLSHDPPSAPLAPSQRAAIAVCWDGGQEERSSDPAAAGVRIVFQNHPADLFVPVSVKAVRYRLELQPAAVQLPRALAKRDHAVRMGLVNRGTVDLEIARIESDCPWLEVVSPASSFTLLAGEPAERSGELSPTTFAGRYELSVICHPQQVPAGRHQGTVKVVPLGYEPLCLPVEINVVRPKPYPDYIGIDFGTTNSVVAFFDQQTHDIKLVEDGPPGRRTPLIPSVLVFDSASHYKIGREASNEVDTAPDRSVRSIKRIMGYDYEREFFGRSFTPEDLAARIIQKLVQLAEQRLYEESNAYYDIRKAIVTVPANFFDSQIRGVLKACEQAGLDTEHAAVLQAAQALREALDKEVNAGIILDEPSAAVLYYFHRLTVEHHSDVLHELERPEGLRMLVFDYGGGTLDVSVANIVRLDNREAGLKVLANMGDNSIGGDSIDLHVMRELVARAKAELPSFAFDDSLIGVNFKDLERRRERESWPLATWQDVLRVRGSWKDLAEGVKTQLALQDSVTVAIRPDLIVGLAEGHVQGAPREVRVTLSRARLEDLLQGILDKCRRLIESALDLAGLAADDVDYVLHTGRQSLLPLVRERVRELFPRLSAERDLLEPEHLKVCVAKGAALYGWMRGKLAESEARVHFLSEGRRLPHSYGVEKFTALGRPELDQIIARGEGYPTEVSKRYGPEMIPRTGSLNLKFYQNSGTRKDIVRNPEVSLVGQITVNTLADGKPGCDVRFVIDANRKLEVFADGQKVSLEPARLQGEESWMG